ncbi:MAG: site-2 protease family protein [Firmicutes bacterium]|nr:site-2 protease family protein [Bacillota bacterium]
MGGFVFALIFAVLMHESGHAIMAARYGIKTHRLRMLPFGAQIEIEANFLDDKKRAMILLAGPFANIIVALSFGLMLWLFPEFFLVWEVFIIANAVPAIINLLPIYPLDGGKLLYILFKNKKWVKIIQVVSTVFFGGLFIFGVVVFNPTLLLMSGMMIVMLNIEFKQSQLTSKFNKSFNRCGKITEIAVNDNMTIFEVYKLVDVKRYTKFVVIDSGKFFFESDVERWLIEYEMDAKVCNVLTGCFGSSENSCDKNTS